ncbi:ABC transporter substrate-binding protein [Ancylobacter sp. MQZ15Z-1]|uniref:ABC transporter substrate-binding protein n=1 Tax=Ancylobacter mangrovi TaxID=2972472 RepID=A0A9X2T637_9HYPH|nr:ABC transporter substrate-binding protein [Ancylobacter mangrovi]MCS0494528.1 ABC transporter substrate-binding protein [Ancylobacter mangrovi]
MTSKFDVKTLERRSFVKLLGGAALAVPAVWSSARAQDRQIVVRDPGNPYSKAFSETLYKPFEQATGIKVVGVVASIDPMAQVKSIVDTKNYIWDGMILGEAAAATLGEKGYLEEHGLEGKGNVGKLPAEFVTPYTVGSNVSATSVVYRTDVLGDKGPKSWADFWNPEQFPGRRSLFKYARYTLEQALLADGVDPKKLYPLDLDRAFKSLDKIKSKIDVWWTGGAQVVQFLSSGEVDMMGAFVARALAAADAGTPITVVWDNFLWQVDAWAIPKGAPKADLMREFMQFSCTVKPQAEMTKFIPAGPVNLDAYKFISTERAALLTTSPANFPRGIHQNVKYWSEFGPEAQKRFNAWFIQ